MKSQRMLKRQTASILGALAVLLGRSVVASACTLAPDEDVFVPSGTVPADGFAAEIGDPAHSMPQLVDDAGAPVELAVTPGPATRWTVKPTGALVPGAHYTFRFQLARRLDPTATAPQSVDLTAGPSAPAPEAAGTLQVQADPPDFATGTHFFHVQWNRAPALEPFASLLEIHFLVDGEVLSSLSSSHSMATISGMCESPRTMLDSCGEVWTVPAGHHTVTVSARLFGSATPLPPPTASVDVQCPRPPGGCAVVEGSAGPASEAAGIAFAGVAVSLVLFRRKRRG